MQGSRLARILFFVSLIVPSLHTEVLAADITWQLENPFRFFADPKATDMHRDAVQSLAASDQHASPVFASEQLLQGRYSDGWAAQIIGQACWNRTSNSSSCEHYDDYINPTKHRVVLRAEGLEESTPLSCTWLQGERGKPFNRRTAITRSCDEAVTIDVPYPTGKAVALEIGGVQVATSEIKVNDILVVGMGDSFASGEGNPDVPVRFARDRVANYGDPDERPDLAGFPARVGPWRNIGDQAFINQNARWLDQACHRSLYSHQLRAALQLSIEDPHRSVTYVGLACSGAEVTNGLFLRYKGHEWVPNPPQLSQISAAAEAQCGKGSARPQDLPEAYHIKERIPELKGGLVLRKCPVEKSRKIDLVFLSIGGNDIGFSRLVANTVLSDESSLRTIGGWFGEVHGQTLATSQLDNLKARYKSLNRALHHILHVPWQEADRVLLTGYPGLALAGDGSDTCEDSRLGMEVWPDFRLRQQKLRESIWMADKLHRTMRESAYKYNWTFVETHRRKFIGRGLCSDQTGEGTKIANELRLPRFVDGEWQPYNPADYLPYASRSRWFRTPNDAFMTGNFHVASSLLLKVLKMNALSGIQLLLASTYSGAFHPTAEGQAAIADDVAAKARVVLRKYGQASDAEREQRTPAADLVPEPDVELPDVGAVLSGEEELPEESDQISPATEATEGETGTPSVSSPDASPLPDVPATGEAQQQPPVENDKRATSSWSGDTKPASPAPSEVPAVVEPQQGNDVETDGVPKRLPFAPAKDPAALNDDAVAPSGQVDTP